MRNGTRLLSPLAHLLSLAALALAPAACGTSDDAPKREPRDRSDAGAEDGGGGDGGVADADIGDSGDGKPAYALDEVCDVLAERQCEAIESCCDSTGVGYDEAGCRGAVKSACNEQVAKVNGGNLVFGPETVDACTTATATLYQKCELSWEESLDMLLGLPACRDIFAGKKSAGEACAEDVDCTPPSDPAMVAVCEKSQCLVRPRFRDEKDPCVHGASVGCAVGLFCNANTKPQGAVGQCEKVKAVDAGCDKSQDAALKFECGLGNHCHPQQGRCIEGRPTGAACTDATAYECASYTCTEKKCAPLSVATPSVCKGEAGAS